MIKKKRKNIRTGNIIKIFKYILISAASLFIILIIFLAAWYSFCFFPNDQDYLREISESGEYTGVYLEEISLDLIKAAGGAQFSNPLTGKDRSFLLNESMRSKDIYIDNNPYGKFHGNNLKYSTGKIFYYIYQKNSIVLKSGSRVSYFLNTCKGVRRFLEINSVLPVLSPDENTPGTVRVYFTQKERELIFEKRINREKKPDIKPFRYSDFFSSVSFYIKNPGRSVLTDYTGWENAKINLPSGAGRLEIEFTCDGKKSCLFIGSPAVYEVKDRKRDEHVNIVYLVFDTLSKSHIDLYEYYTEFKDKKAEEVIAKLGGRKTLTPAIDRFSGRALLFENMQSAGQVTRPSIVALWTSKFYTRCRQPVFRNIVTKENADEFYNQDFTTLGNELSDEGYITKQISCNAQGHGVSGVGVDLGFGENYDYTMEASEHPENVRRIIEFLNINQNRKFFLYAHLNVPHDPMWIPLGYYLQAWIESGYKTKIATTLGNIRYLNDCLSIIINTFEKLKLDKNTVLVITSDHGRSRVPLLRGEPAQIDKTIKKRESQSIATFPERAIYVKSGKVHLLGEYMNIPWILIPPRNLNFIPGKIESFASSLDISPTLLDIAANKSCTKFAGRSFKTLLADTESREKVFSDFIPLLGRFQNGFISDGRYKYWINLQGIYKFKIKNNKKYLMQQEYLYDLKNDPEEINNLVHDPAAAGLLKKIRMIYFDRFPDFPDKNFIQISPCASAEGHLFKIKAVSRNSKIIYPKIYGKGIEYNYLSGNEIDFTCKSGAENLFLSFETDPPDAPVIIQITMDGIPLSKNQIFSSVENINYFDNPIVLNGKIDFQIARTPGRTGLEPENIPSCSVRYSRIPLNYWLEMNMSEKDINLSPGIKEVLRGWGYIQ
ncbi:MAG: sulfatase-like hydrolase/transferase [Spirochaetes bacterium]|nr:sulfatase-like hydrolase/transferase [Spirochaetota bacterium]